MSKKAILIIMDGWGLGKVASADAIQQAQVPYTNNLYKQYAHTTLTTCGEAVGLPEGQMGNSEVGHLNLGAGRIVYQELERIHVAIKNKTINTNEALLQSITYAKQKNKPLHIMGLVSDGGVHSHINHAKALATICQEHGLTKVFFHVFTDGRDTDPKSGLAFITDLQNHLNTTVGTIASVSGRYYAMDRDKRWERVALAYNALVKGQGPTATNAIQVITDSYAKNITDEFILPTVITNNTNTPLATIQNGDAVLCFNFRTDRCREITEVLTQFAIEEQGMQPLQLNYTTFTEYDKTYKNVAAIFTKDNLNNTLGDVLAQNNKTQIRIAETEKYPHVTFFFSGGREKEFDGESRILVPSPKVATYDLQPEMSAYEITEKILPHIQEGKVDFICLNFANTDMVGHTGVFTAAIKAAETVDACVGKILDAALASNYTAFVLADHGNADFMINEDGSPNTAHTLNPVPLIVVTNEKITAIKEGKLGDVAPTILNYMQIPIPKEMDGIILTTFN
jgi:2,3-bisphosphoglycerate-independent phosphoglycerate mutase